MLAALTLSATSTVAAQLNLTLDGIEAPGFTAKAVTATFNGGALRLTIGEVTIYGRTWRSLRVSCTALRLEPDVIECREGTADVGARIPIAFSYSTKTRSLELTLSPAARETWRLNARFGEGARQLELAVENGALAHLAPWLPANWPKTTAGTLNGTMALAGSDKPTLTAELAVRGAAFSDASGLHAGEKVEGTVSVNAEPRGEEWHWRATLSWKDGEIFWQPLYLRGAGHTLAAEGTLDASRIAIKHGRVRLASVGEAEFDGAWDRQSGSIVNGSVRSGRLEAGALYAQVLKPFLAGTVLGYLRMEGGVEIAASLQRAQLAALDLKLDQVSLEDLARRFGLFGVTGRIPWHPSEATTSDVVIEGGEVLRLPFGRVRLPVEMRGLRFALDKLEVPLLDGTLTVNDFRTASGSSGWRWRFSGGITPISMTRFTQSVGLPIMHGTLSAEIPEVRYFRSTLTVDGALLFKVFDGTVVAKNVILTDPFGKAPRVAADLDVRGLDLELLTRTYSFGSITGRVDASVAGLELADWQPVKFDARVASSPGEYPKKISQSAVQNISALGGASAAAAIQRTFLRFFEEFGYEKLGLRCRLENGVCEMGGVEDAPQGYLIVKGGGVPAITVMGYNRAVDWLELVDRLKRIMRDNVRAIVR